MAHKFKVGDRVVSNGGSLYCNKGDKATLIRDDGTDSPLFELDNGSHYYIRESTFDLDAITFDQMMEAFKKHLPDDATWYDLQPNLRAYRSGGSYLSIKINNFSVDLHISHADSYLTSVAAQTCMSESLKKLKEYEAEQAPVEMTIGEIADKLGIDSSKLKIKE